MINEEKKKYDIFSLHKQEFLRKYKKESLDSNMHKFATMNLIKAWLTHVCLITIVKHLVYSKNLIRE